MGSFKCKKVLTTKERGNEMRTTKEIKNYFEAKGFRVVTRALGMSYRAGGEIFILSPRLENQELENLENVTVKVAEEAAFDGTGYDGRGCKSIIVAIGDNGRFSTCTSADFYQSAEADRFSFGNESRSCSNELFFCDKSKNNQGDLTSLFEELGL